MFSTLLLLTALASPVPNGGVLDNDTDPDGDAIVSAVLVTPPEHGTLDFQPDGTFSYTPEKNFNGEDSFAYAPIDETGMKGDPTPVTITVKAVGDPPIGSPDSYNVDEDGTLVVPPPEVVFDGPAYEGDVDTAEPGSGAEAKWTFTLDEPGIYQVSATWPPTKQAATNSPFRVFVDGMPNVANQRTVRVDQRRAPVGFVSNGTLWQTLALTWASEGITVTLRGDEADGLIVADAIMVQYMGIVGEGRNEAVPSVQTKYAIARNEKRPSELRTVWAPVIPDEDAIERRPRRDE